MLKVVQTHTHDLTFTESEVSKRYVRWDRGEPDREWGCLMLLADHAPGVAPRPLRRETHSGVPVVVMERLPGEPLGGAPLTPGQTQSLGAALRRLYDVPLEAVEAAQVRERLGGPTALPQTLSEWLADAYELGECRDPAVVGSAVEAARAWLASGGGLPEPHLRALGIGDLNPANILWDGEDCRLVDFEDGGLTDPAYELADHIEHLAGRTSGVFDCAALVDAVRLTAREQQRMRAYRPLWAVFWLAMLLPGNAGFRRNPPGSTETQASHCLALLA